MSDITNILTENQKEMLKLLPPPLKNQQFPQNLDDPDSETENTHPASTSTPIKPKGTFCKKL